MKKFITPTIIIFAILVAGSSAYAAVRFGTINAGMVAYWSFDFADNGEVSILDKSGNGNDIPYGTIFADNLTDGYRNEFIAFSGAMESGALVPDLGNPDDDAFTVSAWVNPAADIGSNMNTIYFRGGTSGTAVLGIGNPTVDGSSHKWTFLVVLDNGEAQGEVAVEGPMIVSDEWTHVVGVYRRGQDIKLYINGELAGTEVVPDGFDLAIIPSNSSIGITASIGGGYPLTGGIDDMRLYNRALSARQVAALHTNSNGVATIRSADKTGLVQWFSFEPRTFDDTELLDMSGNMNSGGLQSSRATVSGKIGEALSFDGNQAIVTARTVEDDFTICAWIQTTAVGAGTAHYLSMPIYESEVGGITNDFGFGVDANGKLMFGNGDGVFDFTISSSTAVNTGAWTHACATREKNTGEMKLYVNGAFETGDSGSMETLDANPNALIGDGSDSGVPWDGSIDELRVYDRVLTLGEIHALAQARTTTINGSRNYKMTNGLVGMWSFDGPDMNWTDATTGVAYDRSENNYDGMLFGMQQQSSVRPGVMGQALRFDGTSSYIDTGYTVPIQDSTTSFTWSTWAKLNPGNAGNLVILGFRFGATWIKLTPSSFEFRDSPMINYAIPSGRWLHIAIVKNGSDFTYYVDGESVGTGSTGGGTDNTGGFYIGSDPDFPSDGFYDGLLDDVRVYGAALTAAQVRQLYLMGK